MAAEAEKRLVNYVPEEDVAHLQKYPVYRFFERSVYSPDCYVSPFVFKDKLEYRQGVITRKPVGADKGISCMEVLQTTKNLLMTMKKKTDRLVLFRCTGYNDGEPPLEYSRVTNKTSVTVEALKPEEPLCTYNDVKNERRRT